MTPDTSATEDTTESGGECDYEIFDACAQSWYEDVPPIVVECPDTEDWCLSVECALRNTEASMRSRAQAHEVCTQDYPACMEHALTELYQCKQRCYLAGVECASKTTCDGCGEDVILCADSCY